MGILSKLASFFVRKPEARANPLAGDGPFGGFGSLFSGPVGYQDTGVTINENNALSAGDATTPCSYTYDVYDTGNNLLGQNVGPAWSRPPGKMTAGNVGLAYFGPSLVLLMVDEVPDTTTCDNSSEDE